ncbi:hypothetical protein RvVAT039_pl10730 (plasmid) [Agrobacterium vitis]|nr:hypothetical protein RvVAT039_pl10730 [Agrobacterium vitis]
MAVLNEQRLIEPKSRTHRGDALGAGLIAEYHLNRIAGQHSDHEKDERQNAYQSENGKAHSLREIQ